jgi:hypothetical protein
MGKIGDHCGPCDPALLLNFGGYLGKMPNIKKTTISGDILEIEYVQSRDRGAGEKASKKKYGTSSTGQKKANFLNRVKTMCRYVNANFTALGDLFIRLSFDGEQPTLEQAYALLDIFLDRVRKYRKLLGMTELKYFVVHEYKGKRRPRLHLHVIMSKMSMDAASKMWTFGGCSLEKLYSQDFQGLAYYLSKEPPEPGKHAWKASKNLVKPKPEIDNKPLSRAEMDRPIPCPPGYLEVYQTKIVIDQKGYQGDYKYAKFLRRGRHRRLFRLGGLRKMCECECVCKRCARSCSNCEHQEEKQSECFYQGGIKDCQHISEKGKRDVLSGEQNHNMGDHRFNDDSISAELSAHSTRRRAV